MAGQLAKTDYDDNIWYRFHESILYVCQYEERLYQEMKEQDRWMLEKSMLDTLDRVEDDLTQNTLDFNRLSKRDDESGGH